LRRAGCDDAIESSENTFELQPEYRESIFLGATPLEASSLENCILDLVHFGWTVLRQIVARNAKSGWQKTSQRAQDSRLRKGPIASCSTRVIGTATSTRGKIYNQTYVGALHAESGKIKLLREALDTAQAALLSDASRLS
jgi:hypothetical protein